MKSSGQVRTRPGRLRFLTFLLSSKISPFETKPSTPATHAKHDAQASESHAAYTRLRVLNYLSEHLMNNLG